MRDGFRRPHKGYFGGHHGLATAGHPRHRAGRILADLAISNILIRMIGGRRPSGKCGLVQTVSSPLGQQSVGIRSMKRIDKARLWVVLIHVMSFCVSLGSGLLKQFGVFEVQEFVDPDIPRTIFVTTEPSVLWLFAACFGICAILMVRTRPAVSAFIGAGVHGIWALYCTHLVFSHWFTCGDVLALVIFWLATMKLVREARVMARNQEPQQRAGADGEDDCPQG